MNIRLTAYTKNANTKRNNSAEVVYDVRQVSRLRTCYACKKLCDPDDMATVETHQPDFLASVQKHVGGGVCLGCIDNYLTCEGCWEVCEIAEIADEYTGECEDCFRMEDPFGFTSERHGWEQV